MADQRNGSTLAGMIELMSLFGWFKDYECGTTNRSMGDSGGGGPTEKHHFTLGDNLMKSIWLKSVVNELSNSYTPLSLQDRIAEEQVEGWDVWLGSHDSPLSFSTGKH